MKFTARAEVIYKVGCGDGCNESYGLNAMLCVVGFFTHVPNPKRKFRGEIFTVWSYQIWPRLWRKDMFPDFGVNPVRDVC